MSPIGSSKRQLAKMQSFPDNPTARTLVLGSRIELRDLFARHGAVAAQLGRFCPYRDVLDDAGRRVFDQLKQALDPKNTFNPGALGTNHF